MQAPINNQQQQGGPPPQGGQFGQQPPSGDQQQGGFQPSGPTPEEALLMAASIAPVRYRVDDHPTCIETIIDFLKTDAGRHLSPLAELLLNDLITRHQQGMVMKMMEDQMSNPLMANPMQPDAVPPTQNPQQAQPAPMPGGRPQQQMSPQPVPGAPTTPPRAGKSDATAAGNRPTPAAL